jgi:hypothetical protein
MRIARENSRRQPLTRTPWVAGLLLLTAAGPAPAAPFRRGDANTDGTTNISDAITVLGFLFLGSPQALQCRDAADSNDSGKLDIADAIYLLGFLFLGGPAPPPPHGQCGPDPTEDELECALFTPCPPEFGPPQLDPLPAPALAAETVIVGGQAAAGVGIEVTGGAGLARGAAGPSGRFEVEVPLLLNRLNRLFVTAVEADGRRSAPSTAEVIHDATPPALHIDEPREGDRLAAETVTITGRVSDRLSGALGLDVSIDGRRAQVVIGIGTNGTYELACPLAPGENIFVVTARDFVGNETEARVRVVRQTAEAIERLVVESGGGQVAPIATPLAEPIIVRRLSAAGTPVTGAEVAFEVVRSDGMLGIAADFAVRARSVRVRTDAEGRARVYWRLGTDAGCGNNRLEVRSEGVNLRTVVCASAKPGPAAQINVGSGNNQRVEAGAPAPERLRAWVSDSCNGIAGVPVTFTVRRGTGRVNGRSSATVMTGPTGHAAADFVLGPEPGNQTVEADFPGNRGAPALFALYGVLRREGAATSFQGLVLDNASQPIGGAVCFLRLRGGWVLETLTDIEGRFRFDELPAAGLADLYVDGLAATSVAGIDVPRGSFPFLHYEPVLVPNAENSLATPVLLPRLDPRNAREYSTSAETVLEIEGVEGLRMTISPGAMRLPDGSPAPQGTIVALNQVPHDQVPMPMPDGAAPPFAWTLQPAGATFDPPIKVEYPNMSGLAPGAIAYFLTFDHDTGRFEIVASGSVGEDGSTIRTDPGAGLTLAGWGCNCPPYSVTGECERCPEGQGGGGGGGGGGRCAECSGGISGPDLVAVGEVVVFWLHGSGGKVRWSVDQPGGQILYSTNGASITVSGANPSLSQNDIAIRAQYEIDGLQCQAEQFFTVYRFQLAEAIGLRSPTPGDFGPQSVPSQGGRIFTDTRDDGVIGGAHDVQSIRLIATLEPADLGVEQFRVRWEVRDPDDPASDPLLDRDDRGGDNTGTPGEGGPHWLDRAGHPIEDVIDRAPVDENTVIGEATTHFLETTDRLETSVRFNASDDGGDNFRLRAVLLRGAGAVRSDDTGMLTVWRKRSLLTYEMRDPGSATGFDPGLDVEVLRDIYASSSPNKAAYIDWELSRSPRSLPFEELLQVDRGTPTHAGHLHFFSGIIDHPAASYTLLWCNRLDTSQGEVAGDALLVPHAAVAIGRLRILGEDDLAFKVAIHEIGHLLIGFHEVPFRFHGSHSGDCAYAQGRTLMTICARHLNILRDRISRTFETPNIMHNPSGMTNDSAPSR